MKASAMTLPIMLTVMIFGFVLAMGALTIKAGTVTTKASIELLRLHYKVAAMHDALVEHDYQSVDGHLKAHLGTTARREETTPAVRPRAPRTIVRGTDLALRMGMDARVDADAPDYVLGRLH